tara:strand:- start:117 stop:983 length:867 start_codon:yes stop_codon:yes gene_type:complete
MELRSNNKRKTPDPYPVVQNPKGRNCTFLATESPFYWDSIVNFDEESHTYQVEGNTITLTASGVVNKGFEPFESEAVIAKCLPSWRRNTQSPYNALVKDLDDAEAESAIKLAWKRTADLGNQIHLFVEQILNNASPIPHPDLLRETEQVCSFLNSTRWKIVRTELAMFYRDLNDEVIVAGMLDMLFQDSHGRFYIIDLKRTNCLISHDAASYGRFGKGICSTLPDTKFIKYSLQCAVYSLMFTQLTGHEVHATFVLQVHSSLPSYKLIRLKDLRVHAANLLLGTESVD